MYYSDPYRDKRLDDAYRARDPYDDRPPMLRGGLLGRDPSSIDPLSRGGGYAAEPAEVIDYSHRQANVSLPPSGRRLVHRVKVNIPVKVNILVEVDTLCVKVTIRCGGYNPHELLYTLESTMQCLEYLT